MGDGSRDDGSWSRAFMVSSGLGSAGGRTRHRSPEFHEASGGDLARDRFAVLARHRDPDVREALARRTDCPMAVLASLSHDARAPVRVAVAANPAANIAILQQLAHDRDSGVLKAVARNRAAPAEIREALARHRRAEVRRVALRVMIDGVGDETRGDAGLPRELRDRAATPEAAPERRRRPAVYAPRPSVGPARSTHGGGRSEGPGSSGADTFFPDGRPAPG